MFIGEYVTEPVYRTINGEKKKVQNKARSFHCGVNSIARAIRYLIEAKKGNDPVQSVIDRSSYILTNCEFVNPVFLAGTAEHKKEVTEQSASVNDQILENFKEHASPEEIEHLEKLENMEGFTDAERAIAIKNFVAYELVMSFSPIELSGLDRDGKAEIMTELYYGFLKSFTKANPDDWQHFGVLQFDTDNPHNQFFIAKYSLDGRKLSLHDNFDRMQRYIAKMEQDPKYSQYLEKRVSNKIEEKKRPATMEEKYDLQKQIQKCFSKDIFDFGETHKNLLAEKIVLVPEYEGNKLKEVVIKRKGQKNISSLGLDKKYHIAMSRYFELKKVAEAHPKYPLAEKLKQVQEIILKHPTIDVQELDSMLVMYGVGIDVNQSKTGEIKGYSLIMLDIGETVKMTTLGITKKQITATAESAAAVRKKWQNFINSDQPAYTPGHPLNVSPWGKPSPFYKKRKRITDYPTLHEYMADTGSMYDIALKSHFSLVGDTLYDKRRNVEKIRIVEQSTDNLRTTVLASDRHTAKAVAQLYLDSGYKGFKITDGQANDATSRNLWREGTLLGLEVQGYVPTQEDKQWLAQQIAPKLEQVIATNLAAIEAYKLDGTPFQLKMLSNQWTVVDRSAVAYAFVDLLKHNLDPMLVLNPPSRKKLDDDDYRFKGAERDLVENYELILKTVADECPEKLELAREQLKTYSPAMQQNKIKHKA